MNFRFAPLAVLCLSLAACTTTGGMGNPLSARWVGKEAGKFFAAYGPPLSDVDTGSATTFKWRGGYGRTKIPAQYAKDADGKKGKLIARARTEYQVCEVELTVNASYTITSIRAVVDKPGINGGPSRCTAFLDAAK